MGCFAVARGSVDASFSATAWCMGGDAKYPPCVAFILGFENPGMTGGEGSPFALPSLLLGGVLKGDISAASEEASGARFARVVSTECDFGAILGLPARFTGGGTGGADDTGRSLLRGSFELPLLVLLGNTVFGSLPGVVPRLGILK